MGILQKAIKNSKRIPLPTALFIGKYVVGKFLIKITNGN
jgi:hypothetical protein